jgi:hypothetical protein
VGFPASGDHQLIESGPLRIPPPSPFPDNQPNELDWNENYDRNGQEHDDRQSDYEPRILITHKTKLAG